MNTTATAVHLSHVENHEGDGTCGACAREGLRWIAVLSDGQRVGMECAKALLGFKPAPSSFRWVEHFTLVATHTEGRQTFNLWQARTGEQTRQTMNGNLDQIGGARSEWGRRGWL